MNFFAGIFHNIVKWWNVKVWSRIRINNNTTGEGRAQRLDVEGNPITEEEYRAAKKEGRPAEAKKDEEQGSGMHMDRADALEILNRINREKDEARLQEIEEGKKLRGEQSTSKEDEVAKVASILNAGRADVNRFIEEGRSRAAAQEESAPASGGGPSEEELLRAQEIIDRLNREAAEDEAKKQAEIDAAKAAAGV